MKLSDGRKVTMQVPVKCEERDRLREEYAQLLADWLGSKDQASITPKGDPAYAQKVKESKVSHRKLRAVQEALNQHSSIHRC
jgi:hypothetical protein